METHIYYGEPHEVMLHLRSIRPGMLDNSDMLEMHLDYYRALNKSDQIAKYGRALNGNSICLLLRVSSGTDFERIILNDPALDKVYELVSVIPFVNLL